MSTPVTEEKPESRRPKDTKFKQQRLPAWQPIMTAGSVIPTFFVIGIVFIPLGIGLLVTSNQAKEIAVEYTKCTPSDPSSPYKTCSEFIRNNSILGKTCECDIQFELDVELSGQVFMYYGLTNFYQNHRRYVNSRDDNQLQGNTIDNPDQLHENCHPYDRFVNTTMSDGPGYAPCGTIANSLFNDTLSVSYIDENGGNIPVDVINTGIAWSTDKKVKFNNPEGFSEDPATAFGDQIRPLNWHKEVWQLDPNNPENNGYENEDLIVWMRTAALPTFRKLYRLVDQSTGTRFEKGLPKGNYTLNVKYAYPVSSFEGTKRMILATTSWLGGKNPFLGIAFIVVGSIYVILGVVFVIIHLKISKRLTPLGRDNETPQTLINKEHANGRTPYISKEDY